MDSFTYHNPTEIFFGENAVENLEAALAPYRTVLLAYGGGSIKRNGIYDSVTGILRKAGKAVHELSGIMPNPRTTKVYEGIELCKKHDVDFILAVGGGSTIDCCKAIAAGAKTEKDFWQAFFLDGEEVAAALPLGVVLTLAATGSEMNASSVISNWETNQKLDTVDPALQPVFAVMDPTYTYTLPREQMVYGAIDTLSHLFESYFSPPDEQNPSDDFSEAAMRSVMRNLALALENPKDYNARSNLMWNSTMALNGILSVGKREDWQAHNIEHALSAFHDIPHGAGLAIVHPAYLAYNLGESPEKLAGFATRVMGIDPAGKPAAQLAEEGVRALRDYFKSLGAPITLSEVDIPAGEIPAIAASVAITGMGYRPLEVADIEAILRSAL